MYSLNRLIDTTGASQLWWRLTLAWADAHWYYWCVSAVVTSHACLGRRTLILPVRLSSGVTRWPGQTHIDTTGVSQLWWRLTLAWADAHWYYWCVSVVVTSDACLGRRTLILLVRLSCGDVWRLPGKTHIDTTGASQLWWRLTLAWADAHWYYWWCVSAVVTSDACLGIRTLTLPVRLSCGDGQTFHTAQLGRRTLFRTCHFGQYNEMATVIQEVCVLYWG